MDKNSATQSKRSTSFNNANVSGFTEITADFLELVLEGASAGLWVWYVQSGALIINQLWAEIIGYTLEELEPISIQTWLGFCHPEDLEKSNTLLKRHFEGETYRYECEIRMKHKNGTWIWVYDSGRVLEWDANGKPLRMTGTHIDITARKQAEDALKESEAHFRTLADSGHALIWTSGVDGRCDYFNQTWLNFTGRSLGQELGDGWMENLHPDDLPQNKLAYLEALSQRKSFNLDYRLRRFDGQYRWVHDIGKPRFDSKNQFIGYIGYCLDITERKQAEEELQRQNILLAAQQQVTLDGILAVDENSDVLTYNHRFAEMWSVPLTLMENKKSEILLEHVLNQISDKEASLQKVRYIYEHKQEISRDEISLKDGRFFDRYSAPLIGADGRYFGRIWYFRDITDSKASELEIRRYAEDLTFIKKLNDAANQSDNIPALFELFVQEMRAMFACQDVAMYMLSPDGKYLDFQATTISKSLLDRIEKIMGSHLPKIRIQLNNGITALAPEEGIILHELNEIQKLFTEFAKILFWDESEKNILLKYIQQILQQLNVRSVILIPLISSGKLIGIMHMIRGENFTADDLQRVRLIRSQMTATVIRKQAEQSIKTQLERMRALSEIDRAINSSLDMRLSLDILLNHVLAQLKVDAASVHLQNPHTRNLEYAAGKGFNTTAIRHLSMRIGEGGAGKAGLERKIIHVSDMETETHFLRAEMLKSERFVEYISVPLLAKGDLKGVLEIFTRIPMTIDAEWLNYLESLGGQAAIAIDNAQPLEGIQQSNLELIEAYDATIAGWSHAMDLRDKETEGHTRRVTELTVRLARRMGIGERDIVQMRRGALLHDIGKLGIPDYILLKPGKLTDEEWEIMRQHPMYAFNMLMPIVYLRPALDIPYSHHEK